MIEDLPDVPPALLLILREMPKFGSPIDMRRQIRAMLPDLRDQSEAFEVASIQRSGDSKRSPRFEIHLHGALDLLSGQGCRAPACRFRVADRLASSVGLIADRVWLTDTMSGRFVDFGRATNEKLDEVIWDVMVLARLLPLILGGIVRFRSPWVPACKSCAAQFSDHVEAAAAKVAAKFLRDFRPEAKEDGGFFLHTGKCVDPTLVLQGPSGRQKPMPTVRGLAETFIAEQMRSTFWVAREAALTGCAVLSNSRVGLAGLLDLEGRFLDKRTLLLLEKERELRVPWVSDLGASEIMQLRNDASAALPAFRERMARAMSVSEGDVLSPRASGNVIAELREQAAEVRSELNLKRKTSSRYWKGTYGLLGLGISVYGVATDQVMPGVVGLLPVIQLLINHRAGFEADVSKLETKPGFVLVKAQDILSHVH